MVLGEESESGGDGCVQAGGVMGTRDWLPSPEWGGGRAGGGHSPESENAGVVKFKDTPNLRWHSLSRSHPQQSTHLAQVPALWTGSQCQNKRPVNNSCIEMPSGRDCVCRTRLRTAVVAGSRYD